MPNHIYELAKTQRATQCMAVCRQCAAKSKRQGVVPFANPLSRQRWMRSHEDGHEIVQLDGWPSPPDALRSAFFARPEIEERAAC